MYFFLAIVLSVLLWCTDYDYPFGIFKLFLMNNSLSQEYLEDTKGELRNHKLKKDKQYNGQKNRTNNDLQNTTQKLKIEQHEPH